jgi:excisionase family DNA binding protein
MGPPGSGDLAVVRDCSTVLHVLAKACEAVTANCHVVVTIHAEEVKVLTTPPHMRAFPRVRRRGRRGDSMTDQPDVFGALLDQLADQIARRTIARIERLLAERAGSSPRDALRLPEVARALGLSEREVRRRISAGELASIRVGRAVLIPRAAVEAFLSRNGTD